MAVTISGSSLREENLRGYAQGEIFLLRKAHHHFRAKVYDTTGFGPVRAADFGAIDVERLAAETRSDLGWKGPRRFWTVDAATIFLAGQSRELQGLMFNLVARTHLPVTFDPPRDQSALAYQPMQTRRVGVHEFVGGRPVFLLRSPEGITWVMQAFTDHIDHDLCEPDLPDLAARLALPEGWRYRAVTLGKDLTVATRGLTSIVQDDLANLYQGCVDGVSSFDPWD
jgi:hypothetical protein